VAFARRAESVYQSYSGKDLGAFFIFEGAQGGRPTRQDCENARREYGLTMPVLFDRNARLRPVGLSQNHSHFVLDEEATIVFTERFNDTNFKTHLDQLLGN
jgi:hypothetical protein